MKKVFPKFISVALIFIILASMISTFAVQTVFAGETSLDDPAFITFIEVTSMPYKTTYTDGETLDYTGLRVAAVYTDFDTYYYEEDITDLVTMYPAEGTILHCTIEQEEVLIIGSAYYEPEGYDYGFSAEIWIHVLPAPDEGSAPAIVSVITNPSEFISIKETAKDSKVWVLSFSTMTTYSDGLSARVKYEIKLNGNNANLNGKYVFANDHNLAGYTLVYDIKSNGSNIKEFKLTK